MNVNHLYHPEEIEDLYALFCLIVTELRTEGFNLSFQFENIDFFKKCTSCVWFVYMVSFFFDDEVGRRSEYYWLANFLIH